MRIFCYVFLLLALVCCTGCVKKNRPAQELPRAAPGYLHWLRQQSMLAKSGALIAEVSQSGRVWMNPGDARRAAVLLKAAPNWLELASWPDNPKKPFFRELATQIGNAGRMGFGGVYFGQAGEKADLWVSRDGTQSSRKPINFAFDAAYGSDEDFEKLAADAEAAGLELGSDLIAGSTGRGPDFFLQARNDPDYSGLYAMLTAPEQADELLPLTYEEWDCEALSPQVVAKLAEMGVLPAQIARDKLPWTSPGGWAATGPVLGTDGNPRRWIYRYSESPAQPVMNPQDPSGKAAKVLAAAAIKQTGLLGEALTGLSFEPLMALEPGEFTSLSPGIDALGEVSRQIHRYGGWAMQIDPLPVNAIREVLAGPCDFCRDDITALLAAYGLLTATAKPLAILYRDWIAKQLDISRLARGFNAAQGLKPALLLDNPEWGAQGERLSELGATVGFAQVVNAMFASRPTDDQAETIRRFFLSWRLGLPGLAFVEFYAGSLIQPSDGWLEHILAARRDSGLAYGRVISVLNGRGGAIGILTQLPDGKGYWLLACNFSQRRDGLVAVLPMGVRNAVDAGSGASLNASPGGRTFRIGLDGREAKNILLLTARPDTKPTNRFRRKP